MEEVYCQSKRCGKELTGKEALVGDNGKIYCFGDCMFNDLFSSAPGLLQLNRMSASEIQKEIEEGRLVKFKKPWKDSFL